MDRSSAGYRSTPRRRRQVLSPSAGVLSCLAVLASSEAAEGRPLSLGFLCPRTLEEGLEVRYRVPPRYVAGDDGLWRLTDSYTLYGSTMCKASSVLLGRKILSPVQSCSSTTSSTLPTQTETTLEPTGTISTSSSAPTSTLDILASLPPGWQIQPHNSRRDSLILALSLVLAFLIIFIIIGCIFWRRKVRKRRKSDDHERAPSRREHDDDERLIEHGLPAKKKLWAKAAARWKANARHLHPLRRRRGKRIVSTAPRLCQSVTSSVSIHPQPSSSSLALSRRSTMNESMTTGTEINEQQRPVSSPRAQSPPAYRQRSSLAPPSPIASTSSKSTESIHFAHVAMDDKTVLEQLSSLVSCPPVQDHSLQFSTSSSAPAWRDEELSDFIEPMPRSADSTPGPSSAWPAPPSKGKMAAYYDYDHSYDLGPDAEPCAPPFEEQVTGGASAPPLEDLLVPSAPPQEDESMADER